MSGRATVVGVGLIGGSIGLALRERGWHVSGVDPDEARLAMALGMGVIDEAGWDPSAEVTFVATPVALITEAVRQALDASPTGLVTDVGSVKASVVAAVEPVLPRFVGSHPLCGSEKAGVANACGDLFAGAVCAVTPTEASDATTVETISKFWTALGSRVVNLTAANHDSIVARTSHLPRASQRVGERGAGFTARGRTRFSRHGFSRHHAACVGFAVDVARHRPHQRRGHCPIHR